MAQAKKKTLGKGKLKKPLEKGKAKANQEASPLKKGDLNKNPWQRVKPRHWQKARAHP